MDVIPLCPDHHRGSLSGIHGVGTKAWPKLMGFTEQDLLDETKELLKDPRNTFFP